MAGFVVTHESLEGFEGSTNQGGKTIELDMNGTKIALSPKQAAAFKSVLGTLIRKNSAKAASKAIVLKDRVKADKPAS